MKNKANNSRMYLFLSTSRNSHSIRFVYNFICVPNYISIAHFGISQDRSLKQNNKSSLKLEIDPNRIKNHHIRGLRCHTVQVPHKFASGQQTKYLNFRCLGSDV